MISTASPTQQHLARQRAIGRTIQRMINERGWNHVILGEKLRALRNDETGKQQVHKLVNGQRQFTDRWLTDLATVFEVEGIPLPSSAEIDADPEVEVGAVRRIRADQKLREAAEQVIEAAKSGNPYTIGAAIGRLEDALR